MKSTCGQTSSTNVQLAHSCARQASEAGSGRIGMTGSNDEKPLFRSTSSPALWPSPVIATYASLNVAFGATGSSVHVEALLQTSAPDRSVPLCVAAHPRSNITPSHPLDLRSPSWLAI